MSTTRTTGLEDDAPENKDELIEWCKSNPTGAAEAILWLRFRVEEEYRAQGDDWHSQ